MPTEPPDREKMADVDADQPALQVDEGAAGVPRVDGSVGLDEELVVGAFDASSGQCRDDA